MVSVAIYSDLELFLTGFFRAEIAARGEAVCQGVEVDNKEPDPKSPFPDRLVVIRDDGSTRTSIITRETSVAISVLAGSVRATKDAKDLANIVMAIAETLPRAVPGNPVAALLSSTGPVAIAEDQDRARQYITLDLSVVGTPF